MAYQATVLWNRRRYVVGRAEHTGSGSQNCRIRRGVLKGASLAHNAYVAFQALRQPNRCILSAQGHFAMCPAEAFRRNKPSTHTVHKAHQGIVEADGAQIRSRSSFKFWAKLVVNGYDLLEATGC